MRRLSALAAVLALVASGFAVALGWPGPAQAVQETGGGAFVPVTQATVAYATNWSGGSGAFGPGETRSYTVLGHFGVPSTGVSAVVVELAARTTNATGSSYLTAWPTGTTRPVVTSMQYSQENAPRSNTAVVKVGSGGAISVYNYAGTTNVTVQITGYFTAVATGSDVGGFVPINPMRIANSAGSATGANVPQGQLAVGGYLDIQASGVGSIGTDATAIFANVAIRDATAAGTIQTGPAGTSLSSGLYTMTYGEDGPYDSGITIKLNSAGKFRYRNNTGSPITYKIDVQGFYSGDPSVGASFTPLTPANIYSTSGSTPLAPNSDTVVPVLGKGGIPSSGVGSIAMTVTARTWTSGGTVTAYDSDELWPGTTTVSFDAGTDAGNGISSTAMVQVSLAGTITLHNTSANTVNVTLTAQGWYTPTDYKPGQSIVEGVTPGPIVDEDPEAPTPEDPVPLGEVSGQFTNGSGNGAAVADQIVTIIDATPPPDDGTEVAPTVIGTTTTGEDGTWTFELPASLPAPVAAAAADNNGLVNLEASIGGVTPSGQPLVANQFVTAAISPPAGGAAPPPEMDAPVTAVMPVTSTAVAPTPQSVTASSVASLQASSADPDSDYVALGQWQSDQAASSATQPNCSTICAQAAYSVGQSSYANASLVPNSVLTDRYCDQYGCYDLDPEVLKRCPVSRRKTIDTTYEYVTVGEGHAYYDTTVSFDYAETATTGVGVMISANGTKWQLAGSLSGTRQSSSTIAAGFSGKGPYWARQFKVPMKFVKVREEVACPGIGMDGSTLKAYVYNIIPKGFKVPPQGATGRLGKDVSKYDGPAPFAASSPSRRGWIPKGLTFKRSAGQSVIYNNAASVFGVGVSTITNTGSQRNIVMVAGNGRYRHDIWGSKGGLNGSKIFAIYSY